MGIAAIDCRNLAFIHLGKRNFVIGNSVMTCIPAIQRRIFCKCGFLQLYGVLFNGSLKMAIAAIQGINTYF